MFLLRLAKSLEEHKVTYALVGGYAVALHGAVRGTVDVDIIIKLAEQDFVRTEQAMKSMGLEARLPVPARQVFQFREEYIRNRNLIAWSFYNPQKPIEVVDILLTHDVKGVKSKKLKIHGVTVYIASIEDLIEMKTQSGRPQDLADVASLKEIQKKWRRHSSI